MGVPWSLDDRLYSILEVKEIDAEKREISGLATSPKTDRVGDIVEPLGVTFKNPIPLLLFHDKSLPVGTARLDKPTKDGVTFTAKIPKIAEPPSLKEQVDRAWGLITNKLIRGVSIGFRPLNDAVDFMQDTGGLRFRETEILELSLVTVPAHQEATIHTIKQLDTTRPDAADRSSHTPPAGGTRAVSAKTSPRTSMKTVQEQIKDLDTSRAAKVDELNAIQNKALEAGRTKEADEKEKFDTLKEEITAIDGELKDLRDLEKMNIAKATEITKATNRHDASELRGGGRHAVITTRANVEPGIEFAQAILCKLGAFLSGGAVTSIELAKMRHPDNDRIQAFLKSEYMKAAIPAGTTTHADWASALVDTTNLDNEFIAFLRPRTILGQFGQNGIPNLNRVPFNVRITGQTTGGQGYWVGQGAAKPLTSFVFNAITLLFTKVAAISVITDELARFSRPGAETLVRNGLVEALIERTDKDLIDPDITESTGVRPASLTNGVTPLSSAGTSADNIRTDIQTILEEYISNNQNTAGLVLIMPQTLALAASLMRNDLGNREFPDISVNGGRLEGLPVIASQYAHNASGGSGNLVVAVNAPEIFLADDGRVTVDASREASLEMSDAPTNNSATPTATSLVSMFQTNSIALRAEREINWKKARTTSVVFMDDVNWGGIGSPAAP